MELMIIIFTLAIIPVILLPVAFVWYLNIGGLLSLVKSWKFSFTVGTLIQKLKKT